MVCGLLGRRLVLLACFCAALLAVGGADELLPAAAAGDPVLLAAGDIAACDSAGDEATALLLDARPEGTVATLGDNAYPNGSTTDFAGCYDPTWGRHKARTRPAAGNHEYQTPGATGYFGYFGAAAGDPAKGWYSYDLGAWHVVVLNSNCSAIGGCGAGSPQELWLRDDLAAHPSDCTLAYWHHPRFSSGQHGTDATYRPFWQALYDYGADVVLNGHDHDYERFAPQDPAGVADSRGLREFVVGTGGAGLRSFATTAANSIVRSSAAWGILRLTLHAASYDWQFVPVAGSSFTDSGAGACTTQSSPPANTAPPAVSGYAGQGQTLSTTNGSWSGSPTGYAYQWRRCDAAGASCADIAGATSATYKLAVADVGARPVAAVTASNPTGSATAVSAPTAVVRADKGLGRSASASSSENATLTADKAVDGNSATRWGSAWLDDQWWRVDLGSLRSVDAVAVNWEDALASSYRIQLSTDGSTFADAATVSIAQEGWKLTTFAAANARYVRVLGVTRSKQFGISFWDAQVFGPSDPPPPAPVNTAPPVVSGHAAEGQTLSTTTGTWSGSPTDYAYRWRRCSPDCAEIGGATTSSYTLTANDVGSTIVAAVTASNAGGAATRLSEPTSAVRGGKVSRRAP
jgi:NedA-like, galactose-binding domain/Calcineurin-like phosphoesterase